MVSCCGVFQIPLASAKQAMGLAAESIAPGINIQLPDGRMAKVESTSANAIRVNLNHPLAGRCPK
jgi:FKBP-type peptidyl-prolyl cis-trans isomerase 2